MALRKESWVSGDGREFPDEHSALVYESLQRKTLRIKELFQTKLLTVGNSVSISNLVQACYTDNEFRSRLIGLLMYQPLEEAK